VLYRNLELGKGLKTKAGLNQFSRMLTKVTVENALNAERA
jgi:putative transposase